MGVEHLGIPGRLPLPGEEGAAGLLQAEVDLRRISDEVLMVAESEAPGMVGRLLLEIVADIRAVADRAAEYAAECEGVAR